MKFGSVPYLNARPLIEGLSGVELAPPAEIALRLREGHLDAALVPLMEVLSKPGYRVIEGVGIGALRMVRSVVLAFECPIYAISTIAPDPDSLTSNALAQVVMERDYGKAFKWVKPGQPADAQVIIGDPALAMRRDHPELRFLDLARAWHDRRHLPFVFAVWAIAPHVVDTAPIRKKLLEAKKLGLRKLSDIASNPDELKYLTENIHYDLGQREKESILAFQRELNHVGLMKGILELQWC